MAPPWKHPRELKGYKGSQGVLYVTRYDKEKRRCVTHKQHRLVWEYENGPIPAGMNLSPKDGDYSNFETSNWELVESAVTQEVGRLAREGLKGKEFRDTIYGIAKLRLRTRELMKGL